MQRSESRRKAALSNFSDEGIEGQLGKILGEFRRKTTGIRGSVIADGNGLTVASDIQAQVSPAVLSAMSTLIAQSGARVFENIQMTGPSFIIMDGDQANVAVVQFAAGDVSLLTLVDRSANLGVLKIEMKRTAARIAAAVAKDLDAEHVKYAVSDALQDFEDRYAGILPTWNGDVSEFAGIDECFEKVLKA